jgi:hypothetical protein
MVSIERKAYQRKFFSAKRNERNAQIANLHPHPHPYIEQLILSILLDVHGIVK